MDKLTDKQAAFVREYVVDWNATAAAKRAGYSVKTSYSVGQENLRKPVIARAINDEIQLLASRVHVTQEVVVYSLLAMARDESVPPVSRIRAWELVGKHLGMFADKAEVTVLSTGAVVDEIIAREAEKQPPPAQVEPWSH